MSIIYLAGCIFLITPTILMELDSTYDDFSHVPFNRLEAYIKQYLAGTADYDKLSRLLMINRLLTTVGLGMLMVASGLLRPCIISLSEEQFKFLHFSPHYSRFLVVSHIVVHVAALITAGLAPFVREVKPCQYCEAGVYFAFTVLITLGLLLLLGFKRSMAQATIRPGVALKSYYGCLRVTHNFC